MCAFTNTTEKFRWAEKDNDTVVLVNMCEYTYIQ